MSGEEFYCCSQCNRKYKTLDKMKKHIEAHELGAYYFMKSMTDMSAVARAVRAAAGASDDKDARVPRNARNPREPREPREPRIPRMPRNLFADESDKPVENKPAENKPVENKPVENKPVENKEQKECRVCLEDAVSCVFIPCGHACTCLKCGNSIFEGTRTCPLCRGKLLGVNKLYLS